MPPEPGYRLECSPSRRIPFSPLAACLALSGGRRVYEETEHKIQAFNYRHLEKAIFKGLNFKAEMNTGCMSLLAIHRVQPPFSPPPFSMLTQRCKNPQNPTPIQVTPPPDVSDSCQGKARAPWSWCPAATCFLWLSVLSRFYRDCTYVGMLHTMGTR